MNTMEDDWKRCASIWKRTDCVMSGEVGPLLQPSDEHLLCEQFAQQHPDSADFLGERLSDPDPYIAAYAFKCLLRVRDLQPHDLPAGTLQRTDTIRTLWGCVVRTDTLGDFFRAYWGLENSGGTA